VLPDEGNRGVVKLPKLVANNAKATVLIFIFIIILIVLSVRCAHSAEVVARGGWSFGNGNYGPVLGLDLRFPQGENLALVAGTALWGQTAKADTNWDWHAGFVTCRGHFCASLAAAYLQREDAINGSHANFALGISYRFNWDKPLDGWHRIEGIDFFHLSNAGTQMPKVGRQAALMSVRLQ
jgi:hypothetical protein